MSFTGAVRGVSFADTDYLILASDVKFLRTLFLLSLRGEEADDMVYRKSQKELKDNLESIAAIPQEVRDLFQVSLLYEQEPTDKNFKAMHSRVLQMSAEHIKTSARLFLEMLQHANLVERNHRVRRWREYKRGDRSIKSNSQTIVDCFKELQSKGFTPEQIRASLLRQNTELVFTAHPTQAARRSVIHKHARISELLELHDRSKTLTPLKKKELLAELQENLLGIWRTNPVRRHKPSPEDEARYGLSVVEDSLWHALPDHYHTVDNALKGMGMDPLPVDCCLLTIGSWMGGDRDGNPYVTAKLTKRVVYLSQWRAAHLYWMEVGELMWDLSIANSCSKEVDDELERLAVLANKRRTTADGGGGAKKRSESHAALQALMAPSDFYNPQQESCEPYRLILQHVRTRLSATVKRAKALSQELPWKEDDNALSPPYNKTAELAEDLMRIYRSLHACGDGIIAEARLKACLWRVHTFGLSLSRLDIRQESTRHMDVLDELCSYLGLGSYRTWSEQTKVQWLTNELHSKRPLIGREFVDEVASPAAREVLDVFKMIAQVGSEPFGAYAISMTTDASDVLAVRLLQKEAGVKEHLRVVPLFETKQDLENCPAVMELLFKNSWYAANLSSPPQVPNVGWQPHQEVMLGYSDSAKDAGRFASVWCLHKAQEELVRLSKEYKIKVNLFHGRGGSVGRGGGPQYLATLSQPAGSVQGWMRVTVQGEVIDNLFGLPSVASHTMERYTTSVLTATLTPPPAPSPEFREIMQTLSEASCNQYRNIVYEDPDFIEYFRSATPDFELKALNLGSRPSKRKQGGIESLRAIPWMFAWTQTRLQLPVWLGVGTALKQQIAEGKLEQLQLMYANWPFFRSTIELLEMVLSKTSKEIAAYYESLLVPEDLQGISERVWQELDDTMESIMAIIKGNPLMGSGMENSRLSIAARVPLVDPINVLQANVLLRMRHDENQPDIQQLRDAFAITVQGVAAGMGWTG